MKKRLISIILAVSMLGSFMAVQAAEEIEATAAPVFADVSGLPCEEAVNHLAGLGVINGRGDGTYAPGDSLSRAEMVAIILRGFGSQDIEDIEKFRDVPPNHWAYMYIETAYKMGIVNGVTETTFAPEGTVTYEQAVKMLVCAVNKGDKAEAEGGWPDGYIKIAEEMDVLQGIDAAKGEAISRGTMAQLVYNFIAIAEDEFSYMYDWNNGTVEEHYNWIRDEKIRGAYAGIADMNVDDTGFMKRLNKAGCNTYFLNLLAAGYPYKTPEGCIQLLDECQEWLKGYENCHTFVKINYGDNGFAKWEDYRKFHPGVYKSSYTTSTCPLDKDYWDKQLLERCIMIAERPVYEGIILDHEMYYGASGYSSSCMCDYCWSEYIKAKGLGGEWVSVAITERSEYVTSKNAREDYNDWFYDETVKMFADLREKVHAVNPKIIFGYMPGYEWMKGMTEGLGTPERPVIILSEQEYWGSLGSAVPRMHTIKELGHNAIYLPGLYPGKLALSPADLEKNIGLVSTTTGGYWMYGVASCNSDEEYYAGLERANKLLDERIESGELVAFPTYEVNKYSAKKIKGTEPTEDEWASAPLTEEFKYYKNPDVNKALVKTTAKILYSDTDMFVRVIAYGDPGEITVTEKAERDKDIWNGPNIEVFWRFDDQTDIFHGGANPAGTLWDAYSTGIGSQDTGVNYDSFEANTVVYDDRWEMTLRIPGSLDGVRTIKKGDVIKMEISRYHLPSKDAGYFGYLVWAPTHSSFLGTSPLYGTVTLE